MPGLHSIYNEVKGGCGAWNNSFSIVQFGDVTLDVCS